MPIQLQKGINLTKLTNDRGVGLTRIQIGLGWDMNPSAGNVDLDASIAGLTASEKLMGDQWFVFYNNLKSPDGRAVVHMGDNRDGAGEGDDEVVEVDLTQIPPQIVKLLVIVSMHDANGRNFTQVQNAFLRIVDKATNRETHRLDLSSGQGGATECLIFAEICREGPGWGIKPVCYQVPTLSALIGNIQ